MGERTGWTPQERDTEGGRQMSKIAKHRQWLLVFGVWWVGMLGGPSVALALEVGELAPDFSLPSTTGKKISLSQFRGKQPVLIEFYGSDFAPTCGANLSARKADYDKFQAMNVQILGISTNHPFSQKTFAESLQLPFPLLSDFPDLKVTRQYGGLSLNATYAQFGIAERAFFLIDKQGIVRQRWLLKGGEEIVFPTEPLLQAVQEIAGKP
jgi:peroxiredoxin Q/BCP